MKRIKLLFLTAAAIIVSSATGWGQKIPAQLREVQILPNTLDEANPSQRIATYADGSYVVASQFKDAITLGNEEFKGSTSNNAYVAKYGADGSIAWVRIINGAAKVQALQALDDGGAMVGAVHKGKVEVKDGEGNTLLSVKKETPEQILLLELGEDGSLKESLSGICGGDLTSYDWPILQSLKLMSGRVEMVATISSPITFGATKLSPPDAWGFMYRSALLYANIDWTTKALKSYNFEHRSARADDAEDMLGGSEAYGLSLLPSNDGGYYLCRTVYGFVDETSVVEGSTPTTREHAYGTKESRDSARRIILERQDATGELLWSKPLEIVVSNFRVNDHYLADAVVRHLAPLADGKHLVAAGYFQGTLQFPDGSKLSSAADGKGGYHTDAFILLIDQSGAVTAKQALGLKLDGYALTLKDLPKSFPFSVIQNEDDNLIIAARLQREVTLADRAIDYAVSEDKTYNSVILRCDLSNAAIEVYDAIPFTASSSVVLQGIAPLNEHQIRFIGYTTSKADEKFYLGDVEHTAAGTDNGYAFKGELDFRIPVVVNLGSNASAIKLTIAPEGKDPVVWEEGATVELPLLDIGDKITVKAESKDPAVELGPLTINGKVLGADGEFTLTARVEAVTIGNKFPVTLANASADFKLQVIINEGTPIILAQGGDLATAELVGFGDRVSFVVEINDPTKYRLQTLSVNGQAFTGEVYVIKENDEKCEVAITLVEHPLIDVEVAIKDDFTYGYVEVTVNEDAPVEFKDGKNPSVQVKAYDKVKINAIATDGEFVSLTVNGETFTNGNVFDVPTELQDQLAIVATFKRKQPTPVESATLTGITIAGNPVGESVRVEGSWQGALSYRIVNTLGQPVAAGVINSHEHAVISTGSLANGFYLLQLTDERGASCAIPLVR